MADGRVLNVLAEGRLVNLAAPISLGHPVEVMDQSFGVQAVVVRELAANGESYEPGVHDVPTTSTARSPRSSSTRRASNTTRSPTNSVSTWVAGSTGRKRSAAFINGLQMRWRACERR